MITQSTSRVSQDNVTILRYINLKLVEKDPQEDRMGINCRK